MNNYLFSTVMILVALLMAYESTGQSSDSNDSILLHPLSFSIKGGVNYRLLGQFPTDLTILNGEVSTIHRICDISTASSYQAHIGIAYQLKRYLSLQTGVTYLHQKLQSDYQQRKYSDAMAFHDAVKGRFAQNQNYLMFPFLAAFTFGKKMEWQFGVGVYGTFETNGINNKLAGNWVNFAVDDARAEFCETPLMPDDLESGDGTALPWKTSNLGALAKFGLYIPITWKIDVSVDVQYQKGLLPTDDTYIPQSVFLIDMGFRFRLRYDP